VELVKQIAPENGTNKERTQALVFWVNNSLKWSGSDYQKRSPAEIIKRGEGNCADLASVLAALLKEGGIPFRWVSEINIQPMRKDRLRSSLEMMATKGNRYSLFGLMHNDHVWLEVQDEKDKSWFPADASAGVVGMHEWIASRMAFKDRKQPLVPEVAVTLRDMYVPIVVLVSNDSENKMPEVSISRKYLIDGFSGFYSGRLEKLPTWSLWKARVDAFAPMALNAFAGRSNLHKQQKQIQELWRIYQQLKREAEHIKH
jgi:hypothetical protein